MPSAFFVLSPTSVGFFRTGLPASLTAGIGTLVLFIAIGLTAPFRCGLVATTGTELAGLFTFAPEVTLLALLRAKRFGALARRLLFTGSVRCLVKLGRFFKALDGPREG